MIVNSIQDAALAIGVLERKVRALTAEVRALQAAAAASEAEPDVAAIDAMIADQLDALERSMAADWFPDEVPPVRAVGSRQR